MPATPLNHLNWCLSSEVPGPYVWQAFWIAVEVWQANQLIALAEFGGAMVDVC